MPAKREKRNHMPTSSAPADMRPLSPADISAPIPHLGVISLDKSPEPDQAELFRSPPPQNISRIHRATSSLLGTPPTPAQLRTKIGSFVCFFGSRDSGGPIWDLGFCGCFLWGWSLVFDVFEPVEDFLIGVEESVCCVFTESESCEEVDVYFGF